MLQYFLCHHLGLHGSLITSKKQRSYYVDTNDFNFATMLKTNQVYAWSCSHSTPRHLKGHQYGEMVSFLLSCEKIFEDKTRAVPLSHHHSTLVLCIFEGHKQPRCCQYGSLQKYVVKKPIHTWQETLCP